MFNSLFDIHITLNYIFVLCKQNKLILNIFSDYAERHFR